MTNARHLTWQRGLFNDDSEGDSGLNDELPELFEFVDGVFRSARGVDSLLVSMRLRLAEPTLGRRRGIACFNGARETAQGIANTCHEVLLQCLA